MTFWNFLRDGEEFRVFPLTEGVFVPMQDE